MRLSVLALALCASCLAANNVRVAKDRMLLVNGQRMFVLGLYENPKDDTALDEVAKAGINLVFSSADREQLDRLHSHGVYAWVNTGDAIDLSDRADARKAALDKMVMAVAHHPALLVWEVPDEALWNVWYGAELWRNRDEIKQQDELINALGDKVKADKLKGMRAAARKFWSVGEYRKAEQLADDIWRELGKEPPHPDLNVSNAPDRAAKMANGMWRGYNYLKRIDPGHPIWMNHAPRNSVAQRAAFNKAADIVGCDIYPVPPYLGGHSDLVDRGLTSVGAYTGLMQDAAPRKPVWMVLQGFGWADLAEQKNSPDADKQRQPTYHESRFMAYDAIVHGARGILYWGTAYTDKTKPFWNSFLALMRELADLHPVLSAPDAKISLAVSLDETWGSLDRGVRVLPKRAPKGNCFIVVNEWRDPLRYSLQGLREYEGRTFGDGIAGVSGVVKGGELRLNIEPYGVHVLQPR